MVKKKTIFLKVAGEMSGSGTCTFHLVIMKGKDKFKKKINIFFSWPRRRVTTAFCHRANAGFLH